MGKVAIPGQHDFSRKVLFALIILLSLIIMAHLALQRQGYAESFPKAVKIVTHVDIVSEEVHMKYFLVILSIMGEVVQFYLIYVVLEYLLEGKFKDIFSGVRYMKKAKKMNNHYIIAGGGRVGRHAADALKKYADNILIADADEDSVKKLRKMGYVAVHGDVLDEMFLREIGMDKAKSLVACLGDDSDNILLVLSAKEMNPGLKVSARANSESSIAKLKHAGASHVVVPSSLGGEELAKVTARIS